MAQCISKYAFVKAYKGVNGRFPPKKKILVKRRSSLFVTRPLIFPRL